MRYWTITDFIVIALLVIAAGCIAYADFIFFKWLFRNYFAAGIFWTGLHLFQIAFLIDNNNL